MLFGKLCLKDNYEDSRKNIHIFLFLKYIRTFVHKANYLMPFYDVQITTDLGETVVLQIAASSSEEAELAAIHMVEMGQADVEGTCVVDCFAGHA